MVTLLPRVYFWNPFIDLVAFKRIYWISFCIFYCDLGLQMDCLLKYFLALFKAPFKTAFLGIRYYPIFRAGHRLWEPRSEDKGRVSYAKQRFLKGVLEGCLTKWLGPLSALDSGDNENITLEATFHYVILKLDFIYKEILLMFLLTY